MLTRTPCLPSIISALDAQTSFLPCFNESITPEPIKPDGRNTGITSGVLGAFVAEKIRAKIGAAIGQIEPAGMAQLVRVDVRQSHTLPSSRHDPINATLG